MVCGVLICVVVLVASFGMGATDASSGGEEAVVAGSGDVAARAGEDGAEVRVGDDGVVARAGGSERGTAEGSRAGNTERRTGEAWTGEATIGSEQNGRDEAAEDRAVLRIGGEPGAEFSGTCKVGDQEREVEGEVPERFVFDLGDGRGVECQLSNESGGRMRVVFVAGDDRVEQQASAGGAEIKFEYSEDGVSSSTSSSASGSSSVVSQSQSSSVSSQSSSVVQSSD